MVLRSTLSVGAASRSLNSKAAFINETKLLVENMLKSFTKRLEICLFYGQAGIGVVESVASQDIVIEAHEWASGIWSGSEGAKISILDATLATDRLAAGYTVSAVDFATRTITVVGSTVGVVATDVIFFKSAVVAGPTFNEFVGLHKIVTNTGTLFNVNASTYNLWKGNVVEVGSNFTGGEAVLSFDKIEEGVAVAMEKGLNDEMLTVICSPKSWKNLLVALDAKRQYDSSYSASLGDAGHKSIKFYGANGDIEIVSSIYCKEGYAYMIPMKEFSRVGSSDVTFEMPGFEGKFLRLLNDHNGYEMRVYTDQSLFTSSPGLCTLLTYIKN